MGERMLRLTVLGMTCDGCRRAVMAAVMSVPGTVDAEVSLETGRVIVRGDKSLDRVAVAVAIADAGFEIAPDIGA